jgi:hypothetical protein
MKNFKKHIFTSRLLFFFWGSICAREKFLLANEEYADNKFVDEANYRVSNSKFPTEQLPQLRKRYLQAEPSF